MPFNPEYIRDKQRALLEAAQLQDKYDRTTTNLIAPASPTPRRYINIPLRHADIAEGLLGHRPYAGAEGFNRIEQIAVDTACQLFGAEHANVQPHSVSQANLAAYQSLLKNGDPVLSMEFSAGGHLTHGMNLNSSGRFFDFHFYGVNNQGIIDYDSLRRQAQTTKPKMIVCGASSYPRVIDFHQMSKIAHEVGAYLLADLSHPAGLIVGDRYPKPFPYCDVVTLTLDKTMLGPHGGIILCRADLAEIIDKGVHPGVQSSIPLRRIYEMAQCLIDSGKPEFSDLINRILGNMKVYEEVFSQYPELMVTGGSDTHLMVINTLKTFGLTGKQSEALLEDIGILTNRQVVPGETQKPYVASGIRLGTTWTTARGYDQNDSRQVAEILLRNLESPYDRSLQDNSRRQLTELLLVSRPNDVWADDVSTD